jgi:hypothetical protein
MYVHKKIIEKITELFINEPKYRDERWSTIIKISNIIKLEFNIKEETSMIKVAFDVDRAFRYIQQHNPELRGETWLKRQKKGGLHHSTNNSIDYDDNNEWDTIQLSLF